MIMKIIKNYYNVMLLFEIDYYKRVIPYLKVHTI